MGFFNIFRKPQIIFLWASQLLSAMGDHLFSVALTCILVQKIGSLAGLVSAVGLLVGLLFSLFGGIYADRWNRRRTLVWVDLLRAGIVGLLPLLSLYQGGVQLWQLILVIILVEMLGCLFDPALQASLLSLAGDIKTLQATNALMETTQRLARIFGPGLAGVFLLVFSLTDFFTLNAVSFGISALALLAIGRYFSQAARVQPTRQKVSAIKEIRDALRLLWSHKSLTFALISLGLVNVAWSAAFMVGAPLLAEQRLHGNAGTYGLIVGAYGLGNILSLIAVGGINKRPHLRQMFVGQAILGAGFLLLGSATLTGVALAGAALAAFGSPMGDIIILSMIQTDFPPAQVSKIYSIQRLLGNGGLALGLLCAALLFKLVSISTGIMLCASFIVCLACLGLARFWRGEPETLTEEVKQAG